MENKPDRQQKQTETMLAADVTQWSRITTYIIIALSFKTILIDIVFCEFQELFHHKSHKRYTKEDKEK